MAGKKFSWEEIRKHHSSKSAWIVIKGKVYDVTKYMPEHPGGPQWILDWAGKDASEAFETKGGMGQEHSSFALELLAKQQIGTVEE
ncbi:MAG: cytochrome b5-like heme/steroid binding domain-containing protein [Candidatus Andersenbacteria bacterium]